MAVTRQILGKVVITNKGEYNSTTIYEILDVVSYQGSSYLSKIYDNNSLPTDDTKWQLLARKGDTYEVSEVDIENIANQITENANSSFNSNVGKKTETFNSNAKTKTDEFNSNANTTVNNYNTNAEQKLREYNENDTVKLKEYNDNATSSVDNYNTNASTKLNEYNTNSSNKLKKYNDNATKAFNNYNSNATTKLDEYNANSDTKLKEYDEHSEELNTKINSTKNELERVKNNVLETGMGKENFIHLEDSAMAELQELEIEGICEQRNTTGKNLLDYVSNIINSINGLNSIINKNGSITVSGKPTADYISILKKIDITDILENENVYTISQSIPSDKLYVQINAKKTDGTYTYITTQNGLSQKILVDKSVYVSYTLAIQTPRASVWGDSSLTITNKYMLCKGTDTADTSFEPYTGGKPSPSPDYPQEIKTIADSLKVTSCNTQFFNVDGVNNTRYGINAVGKKNTITLNGTNNSPGSIVGNSQIPSDYAILSGTLPKGNYKLVMNILGGVLKNAQNGQSALYIRNSKNEVIAPSIPITRDATVEFTNNNFTDYYIQIYINQKDCIFDNYRIGLLITPNNTNLLQEKIESTIQTNLPDEEFIGKINDTYKDTLNVKFNENDGQYHLTLNKKISKKIFNGGSNEHWDSYTTNGLLIFRTIMGEIKSYNQRKIISNYFKNAESESITENGKINNIYHNYFNLEFSNQSCADIEAFKKWLATHNTEVYYILTEPYEIDLGIVEMPITYNEITNIFTDSDLLPQINVKYYRNFTKTIQNLQINNDTLKNELSSIENRLTALENANATAESEVSE